MACSAIDDFGAQTVPLSGEPEAIEINQLDNGLVNAPLPAVEQRWALFMDVDGTLLELAVSPDAVVMPRQLPSILERLQVALDGAVALVSGRSIASLDGLFNPLLLPCAGLHGLERRSLSGAVEIVDVDPLAIAQMHRRARALGAAMPQVLVEDKNYAIGFHYRQAPELKAALLIAVTDIARDCGFEIQAGHYLFEIKPAGADKGSALDAFLREAPFAGRTPIFLGDDLTDEFALATVRQHEGMAIQVGPRISAAANFALKEPAVVLQWLQRWLERDGI